MALTHEFLRTFLSTAFNADPKFVVPKQGNWFNPQDASPNDEKASTWCAFRINHSTPRVIPFYQLEESDLGVKTNVSTNYMISEIQLQLVGSKAEENAISVAHWMNRFDLNEMLSDNLMQFCADGLGKYVVSQFYQDGLNTVLAYNLTFMLQWASTINTAQTILTTVNIEGGEITYNG